MQGHRQVYIPNDLYERDIQPLLTEAQKANLSNPEAKLVVIWLGPPKGAFTSVLVEAIATGDGVSRL